MENEKYADGHFHFWRLHCYAVLVVGQALLCSFLFSKSHPSIHPSFHTHLIPAHKKNSKEIAKRGRDDIISQHGEGIFRSQPKCLGVFMCVCVSVCVCFCVCVCVCVS